MFGLRMPELLLIFGVLLLLFGAKRLPDLAKAIGNSLRDFKKGVSGDGLVEADAPTAAAVEPTGAGDKRHA